MKKSNSLSFFWKFIARTSLLTWDAVFPQFDPNVTYKHYLRFEHIDLRNEVRQKSSIKKLIHDRRSRRLFSGQPSREEIGFVLNNACGLAINSETNDYLRTYPSAGARYPLETYLIALTNSAIPMGVYHYNLLYQRLEVLDANVDPSKIHSIFSQEFLLQAPLIVVLTACPSRTLSKYSERGVRHIFLEAGHVGQNICLLCEEAGLSCCPIGGFLDAELRQLLHIDETEETPVYALAFGRA